LDKKKLYIASDHAGFDLKRALLQNTIAEKHGFEVVDLGPASDDRVDYPDFSDKVVSSVLHDQGLSGRISFGVLICGSGQGMAMSANRHKGIRAALAWSEESAKLSRQHNNSNILCLGARLIDPALAGKILESFLGAEFEGGRHAGRIEKF
jgi:ribose 5-phosphate isomerase B